jgi:hypothetical protein
MTCDQREYHRTRHRLEYLVETMGVVMQSLTLSNVQHCHQLY